MAGLKVDGYFRRTTREIGRVWRSPGMTTNWNKSIGVVNRARLLGLKTVDLAISSLGVEGRALTRRRNDLLDMPLTMRDYANIEHMYGANNYHPLDVVLDTGEGAWVWDVEGNRYLDCLSGYSALNLGHSHPRIIKALKRQAGGLTLTSRAFRNPELPLLERELCALTGLSRMLPMNTGAEAVETAVKLARLMAWKVMRIPRDQSEIIVCSNNFHGRTVTIISFSTEAHYRDGFGPFTPGFVTIPFGDAKALEQAITPKTAAFLVEPIQAEAGILLPPAGYLRAVKQICDRHGILFMADEIQTGLGRTGQRFACDHENVTPDVLIVGKSLGGGVMPISAVLASSNVMGVFEPGQHGSTFGGNPLACRVARESLAVMEEEGLSEKALHLGEYFIAQLRTIRTARIKEIRGWGLLIGVELYPWVGGARKFCEALAGKGILCKETHDNVIRFAPPLIITREELDWAIAIIKETFAEVV